MHETKQAMNKTADKSGDNAQSRAHDTSDFQASRPLVQDRVNRSRTTGLPAALQHSLEHLSGTDLSTVRVHQNSPEPDKLNAHAYTEGNDIYIAPGKNQYLPHEGWHAAQQLQGRVAPTVQLKDKLLNQDHALEREADRMGVKAMQLTSSAVPTGSPSMQRGGSHGEPAAMGRNLKSPVVNQQPPTVQRAMKFELQTKNYLWRSIGSINPLLLEKPLTVDRLRVDLRH